MEIKSHQRIERSKLNDYISNYTIAVLRIQNVGTGVKKWIQNLWKCALYVINTL